MDRRSFLKGCGVLALGTLLSPASARVTDGWGDECIQTHPDDYQQRLVGAASGMTIDDFIEGGSDDRRSLFDKLENDQVLTRHLGNIHSLSSEQPVGEHYKVVWTLRELVRHTNPDAPHLYDESDMYGRDGISLDEALSIVTPHLDRFAELSRRTGIDDRFMVAKIARESNGDLFADTGALGLTQVDPLTYADHVRWAGASVASNRAVLPEELYESFVSGERPLRDALLFTPEVASSMGLRLDQRSIGRSDQEYLDRWLPFGIVVEKNHDGRFPAKGGAYETLLTADTSITSGGLVALSYLLRLNHVSKNTMLPEFAYDPAQVLARSVTPPEALAAAFNAGDGYATGRLSSALASTDDPTRKSVSEAYARFDIATEEYRSKVLSSTGALQSLTKGTVSLR